MKRVTITALLVAASFAEAQAPAPAGPPPTGIVVGSGNFFSPIVRDLDKAVAFYRDGLGFEVPGQPTDAAANPQLRDMFGLPDAKIRWMIGRAPGITGGIEIVEISGAKARALRRHLQDPGAFTLVVTVRDLEAVAASLHKLGARVLTPGGLPALVPMSGAPTRILTVQDPDGHFVEIIQAQEVATTSVPVTANIVDARVRLTVQNLDSAVQLYHDALGLQLINRSEFISDRAVAAALGVTGARFRIGTLQVPQSGLMFELIEFAGTHRSLHANIQDPGSTRMQLRVRNVDEAIAAFEKFGGEVISTGGRTVELPAGNSKITVAIDREPDNLFIVMLGARPPAR